MKENGLARGVVVAQILEEARHWLQSRLGAQVAQAATFVAIAKGEITIKAKNQMIASEISLHARGLLEHLNAKFKGNIVDRVRFI